MLTFQIILVIALQCVSGITHRGQELAADKLVEQSEDLLAAQAILAQHRTAADEHFRPATRVPQAPQAPQAPKRARALSDLDRLLSKAYPVKAAAPKARPVYPQKVNPEFDRNIRDAFTNSKDVAALQKKHFNQPLLEAGIPIDWRLWVALTVSNEHLALDMLKNYSDSGELTKQWAHDSVTLTMADAVGMTKRGQYQSVINLAIYKGYHNVTAQLLQQKTFDPNQKAQTPRLRAADESPLFAAVHAGNIEAIGLLLRHPQIEVNRTALNGKRRANVIEYVQSRKEESILRVFHDEMCRYIETAPKSEHSKREEFIRLMPYEGKCAYLQRLPYAMAVPRKKTSMLWSAMGVISVFGGIAILAFIWYKHRSIKSAASSSADSPSISE